LNKFNIKSLSLANKLYNITQKLDDIIMSPSGNKETNYHTTAIQQNPASQTNNK